MGDDQLRLYRTLSRAPFPKTYVGKVFLTAFFGTHVPLLTLLVYFARYRRFGLGGALRILSVTVPATLGGTALTLWAMYSLSAPTALAGRVTTPVGWSRGRTKPSTGPRPREGILS
jgi:hypothetical protein